ncbi:GNAT family N-acetyltransferase [Halobacillus locisalis]|uniref:GNAT family N-acetyltransferase n=1 Tax=Halobacillus locisalis TaxID=220753 RepID=A0A838CPJ7_9BACI|nr:GNAT family N-acetyltransferase [Halobacillus locisalis]MBA2173759.1 GNAT family N-acetyltransferase [Halobacillus locisalis]
METGVVRIQPYSGRYLNQIVDLILSIQQEEFGVKISQSDQPDLLEIEEVYQRAKGNFWFAIYGEEVIGTIGLFDLGEGQFALKKKFVKKTYRGHSYSVGHNLLQTATQWASEHKASEIYLGTTPQFKAAHRFYEKSGFEAISREQLPEGFPLVDVDRLFYRKGIEKGLKREGV